MTNITDRNKNRLKEAQARSEEKAATPTPAGPTFYEGYSSRGHKVAPVNRSSERAGDIQTNGAIKQGDRVIYRGGQVNKMPHIIRDPKEGFVRRSRKKGKIKFVFKRVETHKNVPHTVFYIAGWEPGRKDFAFRVPAVTDEGAETKIHTAWCDNLGGDQWECSIAYSEFFPPEDGVIPKVLNLVHVVNGKIKSHLRLNYPEQEEDQPEIKLTPVCYGYSFWTCKWNPGKTYVTKGQDVAYGFPRSYTMKYTKNGNTLVAYKGEYTFVDDGTSNEGDEAAPTREPAGPDQDPNPGDAMCVKEFHRDGEYPFYAQEGFYGPGGYSSPDAFIGSMESYAERISSRWDAPIRIEYEYDNQHRPIHAYLWIKGAFCAQSVLVDGGGDKYSIMDYAMGSDARSAFEYCEAKGGYRFNDPSRGPRWNLIGAYETCKLPDGTYEPPGSGGPDKDPPQGVKEFVGVIPILPPANPGEDPYLEDWWLRSDGKQIDFRLPYGNRANKEMICSIGGDEVSGSYDETTGKQDSVKSYRMFKRPGSNAEGVDSLEILEEDVKKEKGADPAEPKTKKFSSLGSDLNWKAIDIRNPNVVTHINTKLTAKRHFPGGDMTATVPPELIRSSRLAKAAYYRLCDLGGTAKVPYPTAAVNQAVQSPTLLDLAILGEGVVQTYVGWEESARKTEPIYASKKMFPSSFSGYELYNMSFHPKLKTSESNSEAPT